MRRLALFTTLATGTLLIGCPNPGIGPGSSGGTGGVTASGGASSGGNTTSSTGGTTTTTTCGGADCPGELFFKTLATSKFDIGQSVSIGKSGEILWTGYTTPLDRAVLFFHVLLPDGIVQASYKLEGKVDQNPSGAVAVNSGYVLTGRGDPTGSTATDGFVSYFTNPMPPLTPTDTATIASAGSDEVSAIVPGPELNDSVFIAGMINAEATSPFGMTGDTIGDGNDIFVMRVEGKAEGKWVSILNGAGNQSVVAGLDRNPIDSLLYLGVTMTGDLTIPDSVGQTLKLSSGTDLSDGLVLLLDPDEPMTSPVKKVFRFETDLTDKITAVLSDPTADAVPSFYVAGIVQGNALKINGIAQDSSNGGQSKDGFVARLRDNGEVVWYQRFTGLGEQRIHALAFAGGSIFAAGSFNEAGSMAGTAVPHLGIGTDLVLFRLARDDGKVLSAEVSSGSGDEFPSSIAATGSVGGGDLAVWMTGDFTGTFSLGGRTTTSAGDYDAFLIRMPE